MNGSSFVAPLELKFASDGAGEFEGYGAVFGNVDSHGDLITVGAFAASLSEHKSRGTMPAMFVEHGPSLGGDRLPAGVWTDVQEDSRGLQVKGKISALDTDYGRRLRSLMQDGAMRGLSIGYRVPAGGAAYGTKATDPRRTLKKLSVSEISIVRDGSNPDALISGIKAETDPLRAATALAAAMRLHDKSMGDSYAYASPRDKALLMNHLRDVHEALTGERAPADLDGWKDAPTIREIERMLREECGLSRSEASALTERRFKSAPRDEASDIKSAPLADLAGALGGFKLPSF